MEKIVLKDEYIKLGQALKAAALVGSGAEAKMVIADGLVSVNGSGISKGKEVIRRRQG